MLFKIKNWMVAFSFENAFLFGLRWSFHHEYVTFNFAFIQVFIGKLDETLEKLLNSIINGED